LVFVSESVLFYDAAAVEKLVLIACQTPVISFLMPVSTAAPDNATNPISKEYSTIS